MGTLTPEAASKLFVTRMALFVGLGSKQAFYMDIAYSFNNLIDVGALCVFSFCDRSMVE